MATLRTIAQSEALRYRAVSIDPSELLSEALRRMWSDAPELVAALTTENAPAGYARFRVTARNIASNKYRSLTVNVSEAEAEREALRLAARLSDGPAVETIHRLASGARSSVDGSRSLALSGAEARGYSRAKAGGKTHAEREALANDARRSEAKSFRSPREQETDSVFRIIREQSLETMETEALRFSAAHERDILSAGRTSLAALIDNTERHIFAEALSAFSSAALTERALTAPKAERAALTLIAEALRLTEAQRAERLTEAEAEAREAEALSEAAQKALAAFKKANPSREALKTAEGKRLASSALTTLRRSEAEADYLAFARSLVGGSMSLARLLYGATDATNSTSTKQSYERRAEECSRFAWRSLVAYCGAPDMSDAEVKRWRLALRSLVTEAESASGYVGADKLTLARWLSEANGAEQKAARARAEALYRRRVLTAALISVMTETSRFGAIMTENTLAALTAEALPLAYRSVFYGAKKAALATAEARRLASLPYRFATDERGNIVMLSEAEAERRTAEWLIAEAARTERLAREALRKAEREAQARREAHTERFTALATAALSEALSAPPYVMLSGSAEALRLRTERRYVGEKSLMFARADAMIFGSAHGKALTEALLSGHYLTAEAEHFALQKREREQILTHERRRVALAPFALAAPLVGSLVLIAEPERERLTAERLAALRAERKKAEAERLAVATEYSRSRWLAQRKLTAEAEAEALRLSAIAGGKREARRLAREAEAERLARWLSEESGAEFVALTAEAEREAERLRELALSEHERKRSAYVAEAEALRLRIAKAEAHNPASGSLAEALTAALIAERADAEAKAEAEALRLSARRRSLRASLAAQDEAEAFNTELRREALARREAQRSTSEARAERERGAYEALTIYAEAQASVKGTAEALARLRKATAAQRAKAARLAE